jgi:hypothetical protein
MYQLLLTEPHAPTVCAKLERIVRDALARPEQPDYKTLATQLQQERKQDTNQPVAWMDIEEKGAASGLRYWSEPDNRHEVALYSAPPQRKPLTDEQIEQMWGRTGDYDSFARAIEAAHGIKE